jgi:hypothetical protein
MLVLVIPREGGNTRTDLDVAATVEQHVITLNVSVYDVLNVEMLQSLASLFTVSACICLVRLRYSPHGKWSLFGLR